MNIQKENISWRSALATCLSLIAVSASSQSYAEFSMVDRAMMPASTCVLLNSDPDDARRLIYKNSGVIRSRDYGRTKLNISCPLDLSDMSTGGFQRISLRTWKQFNPDIPGNTRCHLKFTNWDGVHLGSVYKYPLSSDDTLEFYKPSWLRTYSVYTTLNCDLNPGDEMRSIRIRDFSGGQAP